MEDNKMTNYIKEVLENMPTDWLTLTTHRLDIYEEKLAKTQFLERFESMANANNAEAKALYELPTAFDYIRLGHPLSCVLEWAIAKSSNLGADHVISFSSQTVPVLAVLRKNLLDNKKTQINYTGTLPSFFEGDIIQRVYGYSFELNKVASTEDITDFEGSTIFIAEQEVTAMPELSSKVDFYINIDAELGSILLVNGEKNADYISDIQHVRRRETIAMTPLNSLVVLNRMTGRPAPHVAQSDFEANKKSVRDALKEITGTTTKPLVGSSGLSIQYAIMMGIVHNSIENNKGKDIKIVVPTNCYGGTNDQARRVAACLDNVEVVDLAVDGGSDMVQSIDVILDKIAAEDAVAYIIAEIPTNPRVEVPELKELQAVLNKERKTSGGEIAVDPVFVLDQTFCPNIHFLGEGEILSTMRAISYASGSKFPSGGKCTAGYVVGNNKTTVLMEKIDLHLQLCDNEATVQQIEILTKQLPSMNQRIADAYKNTRAFVNFIHETLPEAKINFVSEELASHGFTPSVFSLDLPTKGDTDAERESYKRAQNHKLINMMITEIPNESKYCVSYGQLKGCYWTIPATSTQGTTKEGDKDYIARVALSANMDMDLHKKVFLDFVKSA